MVVLGGGLFLMSEVTLWNLPVGDEIEEVVHSRCAERRHEEEEVEGVVQQPHSPRSYITKYTTVYHQI